MNLGNVLELLIIGFIVCAIGYVIWRGGATNPVGTARLSRQMSEMKTGLAQATRRTGGIETRLDALEQESAKKSDIARLERQISGNDEKMDQLMADVSRLREISAERHASGEHVRRQVDRLYDAIVERGMK